jgi:PqqD family protein of HPr-rel-A system
MLSSDQVVRRDKRTASRIWDGEAVVLTPMSSKIHGLNETGSRIWELLVDEPTVGELAAQIHREFEVSEEQARVDVITFIEELVAWGLIMLEKAG